MNLIQSSVHCSCITTPHCPLLSLCVFTISFPYFFYALLLHWQYLQLIVSYRSCGNTAYWSDNAPSNLSHLIVRFHFTLGTSYLPVILTSVDFHWWQWYQLFHSFLEKPTYYYALGLNIIWRKMFWKKLKVKSIKTRYCTVLSKNRKLLHVFPFCFHQNQNNFWT